MGMWGEAAAPRKKQERKTLDQTLWNLMLNFLWSVSVPGQGHCGTGSLCYQGWDYHNERNLSSIQNRTDYDRTGWHKMGMKIKSTNHRSAAQGKWMPASKSFSVGNKKFHWAEDKPSDNVTTHKEGDQVGLWWVLRMLTVLQMETETLKTEQIPLPQAATATNQSNRWILPMGSTCCRTSSIHLLLTHPALE